MRLLPMLALAVLLVGPLTGCERESETTLRTSVREEGVKPPVEKPAPELISTQQAFTEVSTKVTPAVVNIRAARMRSLGGEMGPLFEDFFGPFFRGRPMPKQQEQSLGSGFLISEDGYILTNAHVISDAEEIKIRLSDRRVYDGRVIGIDPRTDIAVLKIDTGEKLPTAVLGDSDLLHVGQWALAIGNPFGLDRTLTVGVISATGRTDVGIEDYEDFIQTDASINPGNSGGPLLNIYGEVIGINTAIVASGQGIGFAIPINLARLMAGQLIEKGEVTRGWLGVSIQPLTPELAESFGLSQLAGALVNQVIPGSPAEKAGLQRGDILLSFGGKEIAGVRELQMMVANTPVGKQVELQVLRNDQRLALPVLIVEMEPPAKAAPLPSEPAGKQQGLGLSVGPAPGSEGVLVEAIEPRSAAAAAGVQPGDLILSVNRQEVNSPDAFSKAVKAAGKGKNVVLLIRRGETTLYLAFPAS
ncbi:MAG: DegQ family serine endoprotease [Desulfuromonadales bacterium]|nr:DegQ family serine endoprotease [Desulfuromonadales bacterium]